MTPDTSRETDPALVGQLVQVTAPDVVSRQKGLVPGDTVLITQRFSRRFYIATGPKVRGLIALYPSELGPLIVTDDLAELP